MTWRKRNTHLQPTPATLSHLRGWKKLRNTGEVHGAEAQASLEDLNPIKGLATASPLITSDLFTAVPFTDTSCPAIEKKLQGILKSKKHNLKRQASEPDMAGMLEFSDQKFETTMFNMLRAQMDKADSMQGQMGNVSRDGSPKEEPKRKPRHENHSDRNEECLWWACS